MMQEEKQIFHHKIMNHINKDHSDILYFLLLIVICILVITIFVNDNLSFAILICSINGTAILLYLICTYFKLPQYCRLLIFISKITTLLMTLFINDNFFLLILTVFEKINVKHKNNLLIHPFYFYDDLIFRIIAFFVMLIKFDLLFTISTFYLIMQEINTMIQSKQNSPGNRVKRKTLPTVQKVIQQEHNEIWAQRIQHLPHCIITIDLQKLEITYRNENTNAFFKRVTDKVEEINEIIMNKLSFSIVQHQIDQIKQFSLRKKTIIKPQIPKWRAKCDSVSMQLSPQSPFEIQSDSTDQVRIQKFTIADIIGNLKTGQLQEVFVNQCMELYCEQNWSTLAQGFMYSFSLEKITLSGQVTLNKENEELIVILSDMHKLFELQQLISNDKFKSKIIESVSHELRTPLNSAMNFLNCAIQDNENSMTIKEDLILPAFNSLKILSCFINDISDLSSFYQNNFKIQILELSIREIVNDIINIFKQQCEMKEIELRVDLTECNISTIMTDKNRLIQILVNLLQNSIKFTNQGIIIIKFSTNQNTLQIGVIDDGIGIQEEKLEQLKFFLSHLSHIDQAQDLQINKTWQGFGLLVSAILISKLAPKEYKQLNIYSEGQNKGTQVSFVIENKIEKYEQIRQTIIRRTSSSNMNYEPQFNDINGIIFQATENMSSISKRFNQTKFQTIKSHENLDNNTEAEFYETLCIKYGQLSPLTPNFLTERQYFLSNEHSQAIQQHKNIESYCRIFEAEKKEDQELLDLFNSKKKCTCNKILSVDDDIFNQKSIEILLGQLKFQVDIAFNGFEAIQKIQNTIPCSQNCVLYTLILMDYQMPLLDGCETTKKIIEMIKNNKIPKIHVVGLTAFTNSEDMKNCLKAGMSDVLTKPLKLKEFKEILSLI